MIRHAQVLSLFAFISLCAVANGEIAYRRVLSMGVLDSAGRYPQARLLLAPDGILYGTTYQGGISDQGTIFGLNLDGSGFRPLHQFTGLGGDGARPYADLVFRWDGFIYGTTERGGSNDGGTIF